MQYPKRQLSYEACPLCENNIDQRLNTEPLGSVQDVLSYLTHFRDKKQEFLVCFSMDGAERIIARRIITIGLLDRVLAHPREVFADALVDRATSIIIAHNHPSGNPHPSEEDIKLTQHLSAAGQLLGIKLRDHIIITNQEYYSFCDQGMLTR